MDTIRRNQTIKDYGDNTQSGIAAAYAAQFYNAMVRTAGWWSDWFGDGTNADVIFSTAAEMYRNKIPFKEASWQYKALYNRDLITHLNSELDADEMISSIKY